MARFGTLVGRIQTRHLLSIAGWIVVAALAVRLTQTLLHLGGNTPTGDDIWPIQRFIVPALDGSFDWSSILDASFNNGQLQAGAFAVYYAVATLFDLNYFAFGIVGVLMGLVRVILLHDTLRRSAPSARGVMLTTVLIAAAMFGFGQIALYEFDVTIVPFGLGMLAFVVATWSLVRWPDSWIGPVIAAIAITIGCVSSGLGPLACPPVLIAAWLAGVRRWRLWTILVGSMALNAALYLYLYRAAGSGAVQDRIGDSYAIDVVYALMGLPFGGAGLPATANAGRIGTWLAVAAVVTLIVLVRRGLITLRQAVMPASNLAFGVLCLAQLYVLRGVAVQYYAYPAMFIWIGIIGTVSVAAGALPRPFTGTARRRWALSVGGAALLAPLLCFTALSWSANRTVEDKMLFSRWRTEISESCIRHYRIAPTACEADLVPWATARLPEFVDALARPLEQQQLGPFSRDQRWSLQGEWILPTVRDEYGSIGWTRNLRAGAEPFRTALRLNLLLMGTSGVTWDVTVPERGSARFTTAVSAAEAQAPVISHSDVTIEFSPERGASVLRRVSLTAGRVGWNDVSMDLDRFAGQRVSIAIRQEDDDEDARDDAILRAPHVEVSLQGDDNPFADEQRAREDDATVRALPIDPAEESDVKLRVTDARRSDERAHGLPIWTAPEAEQPRFTYTFERPICARDYSEVAFTMGIDPPWTADPHDLVYENHAAKVYLRLVGMKKFEEAQSMLVPFHLTDFSGAPQATKQERELFAANLAASELEPHTYWYPFRSLGLAADARIEAIAFAPYQRTMRGTTNRFVISDFRLVERTDNALDTCDD